MCLTTGPAAVHGRGRGLPSQRLFSNPGLRGQEQTLSPCHSRQEDKERLIATQNLELKGPHDRLDGRPLTLAGEIPPLGRSAPSVGMTGEREERPPLPSFRPTALTLPSFRPSGASGGISPTQPQPDQHRVRRTRHCALGIAEYAKLSAWDTRVRLG